MKKVLIFTTKQGHESIAQAIREDLEGSYKVKIYTGEILLQLPYVAIYQFLPSAGAMVFSVSKQEQLLKQIKKTFQSAVHNQVVDQIEEFEPDIIINCFYVFAPTLEQECESKSIALFNVITDPLTFHPALISIAPYKNLVFDNFTTQMLNSFNPEAVSEEVGWFVGDRFEQEYDQKKVRKKLNLDPNMMTFLIASGSEGTNLVLKILPTLFLAKNPVQIVVACGRNKTLKMMVEQTNNLLSNINSKAKIIALGYTDHMEQYMQAADLVIGKAGPNTLFETVATHTPFFAITHIHGQEDGNLEIIERNKLGYVEERFLQMQQLLRDIIENPEQLDKFKKPLAKMAKYNSQAKQKLLKLLKSLDE